MPERFEGKYLVRTGAAIALVLGSAALAAEAEQNNEEPVAEKNEATVEALWLSEPAWIEAVEPETTTTTTTTSTTTTTTTVPVATTVPSTTTTTLTPIETVQYPENCYAYVPILEQYDWPLAGAMRTMYEESRCNPNAVSATDDHGLFQIHGEEIYDPEANIQRAYEKYADGRRGSFNFSAWYAVCTPDLRPKFEEVHCT